MPNDRRISQLYGPDNKPLPLTPITTEATSVARARQSMPDAQAVRGLGGQMALLNMDAVNPGRWPFDPNVPLPPTINGGEPIRYAPRIGENLIYDIDAKKIIYKGVPNQVLRLFADKCVPIRVVINQLKREILGFGCDIVPDDAADSEDDKSPARKTLTKWSRKPDGRRTRQQWLNAYLEDLLVLGAAATVRLETAGGMPAGMKVIDAAYVGPIVTASGEQPDPPFAAWYYNAYGLPYREYTADQLNYDVYDFRSWTPFGLGAVEATFSYVELAINRSIWYVNFYDASNIPPGWATLPESWSQSEIKSFAEWFKAFRDTGNTRDRHELAMMPGGTKYESIKQSPDWQYEFDEYILRVFAWSLGVSAAPIVKNQTMGKGTEGLTQEALAGGANPIKEFIANKITDYIQDEEYGMGLAVTGQPTPVFRRGFGQPGYRFDWVEEREENKEVRLQEEMQLQDHGNLTVNQIRAGRGLDPFDKKTYPLADEPLIKTTAGYISLRTPAETLIQKPPQEQPDALAAGGDPEAKGKGIPPKKDAEPVADDQGLSDGGADEAKADLRKWKRLVKAGKHRPFVSNAIPDWKRHQVEKALAEGLEAEAFADMKPLRFEETAAHSTILEHGRMVWSGLLKSMTDQIIRSCRDTFKSDADSIQKPDYTKEEWAALVAWLTVAYEAGLSDSTAIIGSGEIEASVYAEARAALLIGQAWDAEPAVFSAVTSNTIIDETLRSRAATVLAKAIEGEWSPEKLDAELWNALKEIDAHASALSGHEGLLAYNEGMLDNAEAMGVDYVNVHDGFDENPCETCLSVAGQVWTVASARLNPSEHPNCVRCFSYALGPKG